MVLWMVKGGDMRLPTGYSNLGILSLYLHETRATTIERARAGQYKTAKQYTKAKQEVWIISTDEMMSIMREHQQSVPVYTVRLEIVLLSEGIPTDHDEAVAYGSMVLEEIYHDHPELIDWDLSDYYVEEVE